MPLILAIEPDRRQAAQLKAIAHDRLGAELLMADTADAALLALGDRVPDLILTPALLSSKDEAALNDRIRALERAAQYVQTLTIPQLAAPQARKRAKGMLAALRREKPIPASLDGCDPAVFAEQCLAYLDRAAAEHASRAAAIAEALESAAPEPSPTPAESDATFPPRSFYAGSPDTHPTDPEPSTQSDATLPVTPVADVAPDVIEPAGRWGAETSQPIAYAAPEAAAPVIPVPVAQPEETAAPDAIRAALARPERLGVKQLWPAIEGLQADRFLADDPSSMNGDAVYDSALHAEAAARGDGKARVEAMDAAETPTTRDDDLQIFDLDLDALIERFEEPAAAIVAQPASPVPADGGAADAPDASDLEEESDEADLEVYDLDLSTMLGEPEEAPAAVAMEPHQRDASSGAVAERREQAQTEVVLDFDADTSTRPGDAQSAANASETSGVSGSDEEDVEVYDLDLNLLVDSFEDPPVALVEPSTHTHVEPKPAPPVRNAPAVPERPAVPPTPDRNVVPATIKPNAREGEQRRAVVDATAVGTDDPEEPAATEPTRREIEEDERLVTRSGIWAPLRLGAHQLWPRLEAAVAPAQRLAVVGPADAAVAAILPTSTKESRRPEWLKAIQSLGRDHSRQQPEREPSVPREPDHGFAAGSTHEAVPVQPPVETRSETMTTSVEAEAPRHEQPRTLPAHAKAQVVPQDGAMSKSKKRRMARKAKKLAVRDEWGFFDPEDVGFAALGLKLDEIADKNDDGFPSE
jgi:hypothetical protein